MTDKSKHNRAFLSVLKFIKPRIIPTIHETGEISTGNRITTYQNGSVIESKLNIPIINNPQKEVANNIGR